MNTLKLAIAAMSVGILAVSAGSAQALPVAKGQAHVHAHATSVVQVRQGGGHHMHGGVHVYPRHHFYPRPHLRHHYWGPRIQIYSGGGGCYWLKEKALDTGSRYWWRRYHNCRNGW